MRSTLAKVAAVVFSLVVLAVAGSALSNVGLPTHSEVVTRLSAAEKAHLAELFHLRETLANDVWQGWGEVSIPVIVYNESYAFLVGYPEGEDPPVGWVRVPWGEARGGAWEEVPGDTFQGRPYHRQRLPDPDETPENFTVRVGDTWAATMQTAEYAQVAFFSGFRDELPPLLRLIVPYRLVWRLLAGETETYVGGLAHETFHAYQGMRAETRLAEAEFAASLEERYPWDDESLEDGWRQELDALASAVEAPSESEAADLAREFLIRREERRAAHGLSGELVDYERKREWLEGLAKYAELSIQLRAARDADYVPVPEIQGERAFSGYGNRERHWRQQVGEIRRLSGRSGETRFYYSGFGQAAVLDRLMPAWQARARDEGVWLEALLAEAVEQLPEGEAE